MKKSLFILLVVLISTTSLSQVKFGVKSGLNIANATSDDFEDCDYKTGLSVGLFAKFELSDKFAFQPELLYSMQGWKYSESRTVIYGYGDSYSWEVTYYSNEATIKLDYINIPLLLKYYLTEGLTINAGPQLGYLVSAKIELKEDNESYELDIKDEYKKIDLGFNVGLAYELDFGLGFDLRYNIGLLNVPDYDETDGKNRVLQFAVSYVF